MNHAIILDPTKSRAYSVQWNSPTDFIEHYVEKPEDAERLVAELSSDRPRPTDTAVYRAIKTFRSLRMLAADYGGNDLDAIRLFNTLLAWADRVQTEPSLSETSALDEALASLASEKHAYSISDFSLGIRSLPIREITEELLEEHRGIKLDPYLLLRHASGALFQEANIELEYAPSYQRSFVVTLHHNPPAAGGIKKRDARYTPTSLARFLAEEAIDRFKQLNPTASNLEILDPACGSGVFLIEASRCAVDFSPLHLRGVDQSAESADIASFAINQAASVNTSPSSVVTVEVIQGDSLLAPDWGGPDIILMNPPFLPWRLIGTDLRRRIRDGLGALYYGQSDTAIAFVYKAVAQLKSGAVLATLVPGPFLDSKAASRLREYIAGDPALSVELIGLFRGYEYFVDAAVEPAFLLISRSAQSPTVKTVIAESGYEDIAVRGARLHETGNAIGDGYEVTEQPSDMLQESDWTPRPVRGNQFIAHWRQSGLTSVKDVFDVRLGIRLGKKKLFLVSEATLKNNASPSEQAYFRPTADRIQNGRLLPGEYVFYPYRQGELVLKTERDVRVNSPWFYSEVLHPNQSALRGRKSLRGREWWELVEPRTTWMDRRGPRILSPAFGLSGSFALEFGRHAVVQGNAWFHKTSDAPRDLYLAYLALLNSYEFESLLALRCPQVQGGQYQLYNADVSDIPLPDLQKVDGSTLKELTEAGQQIASGGGFDPTLLSGVVCKAYGLTADQFHSTFAPGKHGALQQTFDRLIAEWKNERGHASKVGQLTSLPSYRTIIALGEAAVPLLLRELRKRPDHYFTALRELTNAQPIASEERGYLPAMAKAWIDWGLANGRL